MKINSKADLNRAVALALCDEPRPRQGHRAATHVSGFWKPSDLDGVESRHKLLETALALAAARAFGLELTFSEGWDHR